MRKNFLLGLLCIMSLDFTASHGMGNTKNVSSKDAAHKINVQQYDSFDIGIDVGGTNTDAALIGHKDGKANVITSFKTITQDNPTDGIKAATKGVLDKTTNLDKNKIKNVMLGTTHLLNAVVQGKLNETAVIRLGLPATTSIPPLTTWKKDLKSAIGTNIHLVNGGYEYDGRVLSTIDADKIKEIATTLKDKGVNSAAITGVFAHVTPDQELEVERILHSEHPTLSCTLSHKIGGLGLIERENATVLNASLLDIYDRVCTSSLKEMTKELGLTNCQLYLSRNDGTLENITKRDSEEGRKITPAAVKTVNSGPSNTMIGAARLTQTKNVVVVDIGGTTTDFGIITESGFPNENQSLFEIAHGTGVWCNFPQPKVDSIGLGGGSHVIVDNNGIVTISEQSVGNKLLTKNGAIAFGGDTLTTTDIALKMGTIKIDGANIDKVDSRTTKDIITKAWDAMHKKLADQIIEARNSVQNKPSSVVLVGGGVW